jgi:hypothetical protein
VLWRSENENAKHNEIRLKGEGGISLLLHPYIQMEIDMG